MCRTEAKIIFMFMALHNTDKLKTKKKLIENNTQMLKLCTLRLNKSCNLQQVRRIIFILHIISCE